jgi:hypothetical protein
MEEHENQERREDVFSKAVRAGKRTYFFDVKATRTEQFYLTVTESKRKFDSVTGKYFYEKHKIFLYQEDFDKFLEGLHIAFKFIETGERPPEEPEMPESEESDSLDVSFEDLGDESGASR